MTDIEDDFATIFLSTERSQTEIDACCRWLVEVWRNHDRSPALALRAVRFHLQQHREMPNDLQDWLFDGFEQSYRSCGEISLDKALGITRSSKKQNAYKQSKIDETKNTCIALMEALMEFTGCNNQSTAASIVLATYEEILKVDVETLTRYYRERRKEGQAESYTKVFTSLESIATFLSGFQADSLTAEERDLLASAIDAYAQKSKEQLNPD